MKNIELIILDIDKTITNEEGEITEYTIETLRKCVKNDINVVFCSGRTNTYVMERAKRAQTTPIIISSNGTMIYNYENKNILYSSEIEKDEMKRIDETAKKFNVSIKFNAISTRYCNELVEESRRKDSTLLSFENELEKVVQVYACTDSYVNMIKFNEVLNEEKIYSFENTSTNLVGKHKTDESFYWVDVINKGNSKGKAIGILQEYLNVKKENTICFGDHINDYSMFEACGIKVAVENAMDDLKEKADYVCLASAENGVAKFIEENILAQKEV